MTMIQTQLANGNTHMICWLPQDARVKAGKIISFVKGGERWTVIQQYGRTDSENIRHGWPVGGLI